MDEEKKRKADEKKKAKEAEKAAKNAKFQEKQKAQVRSDVVLNLNLPSVSLLPTMILLKWYTLSETN